MVRLSWRFFLFATLAFLALSIVVVKPSPVFSAEGCAYETGRGPCVNNRQEIFYECRAKPPPDPYNPDQACGELGTECELAGATWKQVGQCSCDANKWSNWGTCSKTCGGGTQTRTNECGQRESRSCNTQACLTPTPTRLPTATTSASLQILNPGFETISGTAPTNWQFYNPSGSTLTTYTADKHGGTRSAKITLGTTPYPTAGTRRISCLVQNGAVAPNPSMNNPNIWKNKTYNFSYWYKSTANVRTSFSLRVRDTAGALTFPAGILDNQPASTTWVQKNKTITIPATIGGKTVAHIDVIICAINPTGAGGTAYFDDIGVALQTTTPTITPTTTITPTPDLNCVCGTTDACSTQCSFDLDASVTTYVTPKKCSREASIVGPTPAAADKTAYCRRPKRTKGDADGDGIINETDYAYYLRATLRGGVPAIANPDFDGDGRVSPSDLLIWNNNHQ